MAVVVEVYWSVLKFFQLFGYNCAPLKSDRITQLWVICLLANIANGSLLVYLIYHFKSSILFTADGLGYAIDFIKFVIIFVVYFCFLAESFYFRQDFSNLWIDFQIIENYTSSWLSTSSHNGNEVVVSYWRIVSLFYCYLVFWEVFFAFMICFDARCTYFTFIFLPIFSLTHLRQFHIMFYTKLITHYLKLVDGKSWLILSQTSALALLSSSENDFYFIKGALLSVTNAYGRINDIIQSLNYTFGFSLFIIKIKEHAHILSDFYWIIYLLIDGDVYRSVCEYEEMKI